MNAPADGRTAWVCEDCYASHHGLIGEWEADGYVPDCEPLTLLPGDVTAGLLWEEHADPDECREAEECECDTVTFSSSPCHGCGSHLAGARYALTAWEVVATATPA